MPRSFSFVCFCIVFEMARPTVIFYYDVACPYAYMASQRLERIAAASNAVVTCACFSPPLARTNPEAVPNNSAFPLRRSQGGRCCSAACTPR